MLKDVMIRPIRESDPPQIHAVALEAWRFTEWILNSNGFSRNIMLNMPLHLLTPHLIVTSARSIRNGWRQFSQPASEGVTWAVFHDRELIAVVETVFELEHHLPAAITALAVKPGRRRQGIGTNVLRLILSRHKNLGLVEHVTYISLHNLGGQHCAIRAGFVPLTFEPDEHGSIEFRHHQ